MVSPMVQKVSIIWQTDVVVNTKAAALISVLVILEAAVFLLLFGNAGRQHLGS